MVAVAATLGFSAFNAHAQDYSFGDLNVTMPNEAGLQAPATQTPVAQDTMSDFSMAPNIDDIMLDVESFDEELEPIDMQLEPVDMVQSRAQLEEEIRREAFDAAITGLFPLRPDQIRQVLRQYDATEDAVKSPVFGKPTPQTSVQTVSLDPGAEPITIRTSHGHITMLNFLDVTGSPWPIADVAFAGNYEIMTYDEGAHAVGIMPLDKYSYGNLVVTFLTLKTPVTVTLRTFHDVVDYRVDLRIPEYGPFAQASLIEGGESSFAAGDSTITSVLDGSPPTSAEKLDVSGVDGRTSAYNLGGSTYVRTPLTLLSPGWKSSASSADGMNVYVLNETPVLLLSDNGKFFRAHLKEAEDLFDE